MTRSDHSDLLDILSQMPASSLDYTEWVEVGMALKAEGFPLSAWDEWSRPDTERYKEGVCASKWEGFDKEKGDGVGAGTLCDIARTHGVSLSHAQPDEAFGWDDEVTIVDPDYVEPVELPESATHGDWDPAHELVEYLRAVFEETEHVCVVAQSYLGDDGKYHPRKGDCSRTAGELIGELERYRDVAKAIGDWEGDAGVWVCHNPVDGQGRANANVTAYRHVLIESDEDEPERQLAMMRALNLPLSAIVSSGNKSMHGIVRIDASSMEEYKRRVARVYEECAKAGMHVDGQNRNPSRLSRLPGVTRRDKRQALVATNVGARSYEEWEDWVAEERDDLPPETVLADAMRDPPPLAEPLIDGILRRGHKMLLAGPSKAGKSFALMELAIAVAEGRTWMGRRCSRGRVMYVNLEIDPASSVDRFVSIYRALGIEPAHADDIVVWNLRGKACPLDRLVPRLIHRAAKSGPDPEHGGYSLIIIDPIYKVLVGDENSASDMGAFCNQFDRVCAELGCAVVYCHHHSKGYQGLKSSMDRMSGSGVFARDPDAILDMTQIAADGDKLRAARDGLAMQEVVRTLRSLDIEPPTGVTEPGPLAAWAVEHLYRRDGDALNERLAAISEGACHVTAWRISFTLREFASADSLDVWFDHPLHTHDARGVLAGCRYGSGASRSGEQEFTVEDIEEAYAALSMGGETVRVKDVAGYLGASDKTVRRRIGDSATLTYQRGIVTEKP